MRAKEVGVSGPGVLHTSVAVVDHVVDVDVILVLFDDTKEVRRAEWV